MPRILVVVAGLSLLALPLRAYEGEDNMPIIPFNALQKKAREAQQEMVRGHFAAAETIYRHLVELAPYDDGYISSLGEVLFKEKKFAGAATVYGKLILAKPRDASVHCMLGRALYSTGKYEEAEKELQIASDLNPNDVESHDYLGLAAAQCHHWTLALKETQTAVWLLPEDGNTSLHLAQVYAFKDTPDREQAQRFYRRALSLGAKPDKAIEKFLGWPEIDENGVASASKPPKSPVMAQK